jgi:hypothetical protein
VRDVGEVGVLGMNGELGLDVAPPSPRVSKGRPLRGRGGRRGLPSLSQAAAPKSSTARLGASSVKHRSAARIGASSVQDRKQTNERAGRCASLRAHSLEER